jgi:hypothetical protein
MALAIHHFMVGAGFREIKYFKNVTVLTCFNGGCTFYFSEMIDTHVVGNTHGPWQEFSFISIAATL